MTCPVGFRLIQLAERLLPSAVAGIVTKLPTGWLALQFGLKAVLYRGFGPLIVALLALTRPDPSLSPGAIGCMPGRRNPREATR